MSLAAVAKTSITAPIPFQTGAGGEAFMTAVAIDVAAVSSADAPVVAAMNWHAQHASVGGYEHAAKRVEFRGLNGRLLHRLSDTRRRDLCFEDSATNPTVWANARKSAEFIAAAANHPCNPTGQAGAHRRWIDAPIDHPACIEAVRVAKAAAHRLVVIDGEAWTYSEGPTYHLRWAPRLSVDRSECALVANHPGALDYGYRQRQARYSPLALDQAKDDFLAATGRTIDVDPFWKIDVLDPDAFRRDFFETSLEQTAWGLVWDVKKRGVNSLSRDAVAAMIGLRETLSARWPGLALNFDPGFHATNWPHKSFASPAGPLKLELALAMERLCDAAGLEIRPTTPPFSRIAIARTKAFFDYDPNRSAEPAEEDLAAIADLAR